MSKVQPVFKVSKGRKDQRVQRVRLDLLDLPAPQVQKDRFAAAPQTRGRRADVQPPEMDTESQERLNQLVVMYTKGDITKDEWKAARASVMEEIEHARLRSMTPVTYELDLTEQLWKDWTPTQKHEAARWLLRRVLIHPSGMNRRAPLTDRVEFDWIR